MRVGAGMEDAREDMRWIEGEREVWERRGICWVCFLVRDFGIWER